MRMGLFSEFSFFIVILVDGFGGCADTIII